MVDETLRYGDIAQNGSRISYGLRRPAGFDRAAIPVTGLQVWVRNSIIRTAYPVVFP